MLILACDTSNNVCSCALGDNGHVLLSAERKLGLKHAETFMPMVHDLMAATSYTYADLDAFACTVGPGSFTGIRIGVAAIQAMAELSGKPAVPLSSLAALAFLHAAGEQRLVVPMIDARNRRVFFCAYQNRRPRCDEQVMPIEDVLVRLSDIMREDKKISEILLCGDAACDYDKEGLYDRLPAKVIAIRSDIDPLALSALAHNEVLAAIENQNMPLGEIFLPDRLLPRYRAKTAAERAKEKGREDELHHGSGSRG